MVFKGPSLEEDVPSNISLIYLVSEWFFRTFQKLKINAMISIQRNENFLILITEQPNGHFGNTIVKLFMLSIQFNILF